MSLWSYEPVLEDIVRRAPRDKLEAYVMQEICSGDYIDCISDFARWAGVHLTASQQRELED